MSNGEGGTPPTDVSEEKVYAVADYMASSEEGPFRGHLYGLARGRQQKLIEEDLAGDQALEAYLKEICGHGLYPQEATYCALWGIECAKDLKHVPGNGKLADKLIVHYLTTRKRFPTGDIEPIGG